MGSRGRRRGGGRGGRRGGGGGGGGGRRGRKGGRGGGGGGARGEYILTYILTLENTNPSAPDNIPHQMMYVHTSNTNTKNYAITFERSILGEIGKIKKWFPYCDESIGISHL